MEGECEICGCTNINELMFDEYGTLMCFDCQFEETSRQLMSGDAYDYYDEEEEW